MPPTDAGSAIAAGDAADELRADAGSAIAAVDTASELRARLARRREEMQHLSSELALFQTTTALLVVVLAAVALWMRCGERSRLQRLSACAMSAGDDDSGGAPRCVPCWELWRRPAWGQELDEVAERFEDGDEETASARKQRGAAPPPSVRAAPQWVDAEQHLPMCVRPTPPGACKMDG